MAKVGTNRRASRRAPDIIVVGGGVVGCALAYDLASQGVATQLIERRELAREASWASAGIISPPGPGYRSKAELALLSFRRYPDLVPEVEEISGISTGQIRSGLVNAATVDDMDKLRETASWQQSNGITVEMLDQAALRQREPAVHERFSGGIYNPDAFSLMLGQFAVALARAAESKGATVREHTMVTGIERQRGRVTGVRTLSGLEPAGGVIIAAGAWSQIFSAELGLPIPIRPVRGQMMAVADVPLPINSVIVHKGEYVLPRANGTVAVGATEEPDAGFDPRVSPAGIAWLSGLLDRLAPSLNQGRLVETWAGLRPGSEDGELIVGRAPQLDNVWLATGHFRSGALLAPATSELLAASIVDGQMDPRLAAFDPARFVGGKAGAAEAPVLPT